MEAVATAPDPLAALWQRVAPLRFRLGDSVSVDALDYRGGRWYLLRNVFNRQQLRLNEHIYGLLEHLDGRRTLEQVIDGLPGVGSQSPERRQEVLTILTQLQAAGMLGRKVLVPGNQAALAAGGTVDGAVELQDSVANMNISIYDQSGQLIRQIGFGSQSPGMVAFSWDGLATDGSAVPPGRYEVRAEGLNGGVNEAYNVMLVDTVKSVSLPSNGKPLTLELQGIGTVDFSQVRQIS